MYDISSTTTYRIMLAASIALLIHTLLGLFLDRFRLPDLSQRTIEFQLVRSGQPHAASAVNANPARSAARESVPQKPSTQPSKPRLKEQPKQREKPIPTTVGPAPRKAAPAAPAPSQSSGVAQPAQSPETNRSPAHRQPEKNSPSQSQAESGASKATRSGAHTLKSDAGKHTGVTQLNTHQAKPLSAYERVLWEHIAQRIRFAPFMRGLHQIRTVRLQLNLMANGTLEAVRVIQSSGDKIVDTAAKHATLMASPYPPPPADRAENGYRFQVELQFTPIQTD